MSASLPPREYLAQPFTFGETAPAIATEHRRKPLGRAAQVQSSMVAQVLVALRQNGVSRMLLCMKTGISERHLRRLLAGEQWMRVSEIVLLARFLDLDLMLLPGEPDESGKRQVRRITDFGA